MEFFMIQSRAHLPQATTGKPRALTNASLTKSTKKPATMTTEDQFDSLSNITANYTLLLEDQNYTQWNNSDLLFNATNGSYYSVDYDYQTLNASVPTTSETWTCKEWTPAQHTLFQTANFFFAAAFLVPGSFKQSVLLVRLRVTCDDTHLHFINVHQFVDSPEWEANHDQSDDVFQVTIVAEEDSIFLCWPRMKLERILRHKAMLKIVLDCIIGKDITQKLYSLNEHLSGLEDDRKRGRRDELWARTHPRSMSMDAVDTGTTGRVRSTNYKNSHRKLSLNSAQNDTIGGLQVQCWVPLVANQFPAVSPFMNYHHPSTINQQRQDSVTDSLRLPETQTPPARTRSFRKNREVKFHKNIIK
ncbi:popeye domain containing protein [Holotrichia oblita]|uniref:Popeye domain containing protein n=2 Tax=Holotrichia oblita TaxID=644536 RepID=A0ACB9THG3_HOLOL|nr:popeye domain containing protein [Holotrichia oblita]KAI4466266.1 popeye domain containing protein [Holotrichia oblita]